MQANSYDSQGYHGGMGYQQGEDGGGDWRWSFQHHVRSTAALVRTSRTSTTGRGGVDEVGTMVCQWLVVVGRDNRQCCIVMTWSRQDSTVTLHNTPIHKSCKHTQCKNEDSLFFYLT
jgi:hypothetical protein